MKVVGLGRTQPIFNVLKKYAGYPNPLSWEVDASSQTLTLVFPHEEVLLHLFSDGAYRVEEVVDTSKVKCDG